MREAADRRPALVLLGGESGIGKTRLVREFEQRHADDAIVLRGEAVEQGDAELPYAPLLGALRPLVRACHPALDQLGRASRSQLAALVPGLDDQASPASDQHEPAGQLRLFEAVMTSAALGSATVPPASTSCLRRSSRAARRSSER